MGVSSSLSKERRVCRDSKMWDKNCDLKNALPDAINPF